MRRHTGILGVVVAFCSSLFYGCAEVATSSQQPQEGKSVTIRVTSPFKAGHILCDASEFFKELAEKESNGRIKVEVQPGAGSEEEINDWCSQGKVEMQATGGRPLEVFAPQYFFFNAPYVMKDFDHFMRVWNGPLGQKARAAVEEKGNMVYLGIVYRGLRQTTANKPIYTPADVYGLKLRLPTVQTWIAVWKEIGADPVPIPLPDLYKSLKEGRAEASEGDLPQIASFKLDEVQRYLIITNHLVQTGGILINKTFLGSLSQQDRSIVMESARKACEKANQKIKRGELNYLLELQRKGMQVVIPDAESFRNKGRPAVEELFRREWPVTTWAEVLAQ
jgi:tripartite ATP-independent transporter DctP family solute receptor